MFDIELSWESVLLSSCRFYTEVTGKELGLDFKLTVARNCEHVPQAGLAQGVPSLLR
jgi:hypothetical protein